MSPTLRDSVAAANYTALRYISRHQTVFQPAGQYDDCASEKLLYAVIY